MANGRPASAAGLHLRRSHARFRRTTVARSFLRVVHELRGRTDVAGSRGSFLRPGHGSSPTSAQTGCEYINHQTANLLNKLHIGSSPSPWPFQRQRLGRRAVRRHPQARRVSTRAWPLSTSTPKAGAAGRLPRLDSTLPMVRSTWAARLFHRWTQPLPGVGRLNPLCPETEGRDASAVAPPPSSKSPILPPPLPPSRDGTILPSVHPQPPTTITSEGQARPYSLSLAFISVLENTLRHGVADDRHPHARRRRRQHRPCRRGRGPSGGPAERRGGAGAGLLRQGGYAAHLHGRGPVAGLSRPPLLSGRPHASLARAGGAGGPGASGGAARNIR